MGFASADTLDVTKRGEDEHSQRKRERIMSYLR